MAIKTFEEIYASLSADEKKLLDNTFAKHDGLKEGWLRQDDYSRKMNAIKAQETEFEEAKAYSSKMKDWADRNVPKWEALVEKGIIDSETGDELWTAQKTELERQLDEAKKAAVGGDMDPAELDKRVREIVKANGGVTPDELKALVASEAKKLAEETFESQWKTKESDFNTKTIPFIAGFSAATAVVANKYEKETGEAWTAEKQKELFDAMAKEQNFDPFVVGEKLLVPVREKKRIEQEIEDRAQKRVQELRGMPGGGEEGFIPQSGPKGALQLALERSAEANGDFESMIKAQTVKAAKELVAEGKN
jgi:hypothetical protein